MADAVWLGLALAAGSAGGSAGAHALLKGGQDKLVVRALIGATGGVIAAPFVPFVPVPSQATLGWLAASAAIHCIYQLVLVRAYTVSDFAVAYPMARGVAPLGTAALAWFFLHEKLSPISTAGVVMVTIALVMLALAGRPGKGGVMASLAAGLLTVTYTVVDAQGVRSGDAPQTFVVWFFVFDGLLMTLVACVARRGELWVSVRRDWRRGVTAGVASLVTYGAIILALAYAPAGSVSALRETSVLYAVLIAFFALRERLDLPRVAAAILIPFSAVMVVVGA